MEKERQELISFLNEVISTEINLNDEFEIPVRTEVREKFIGQEPEVVEHINTCSKFITKYFQSVLGWIALNPNKKDIVEAISSAYVFTDKRATESNNLVNTEEGNHSFFVELTNDSDSNTFFLIGPKGSVKTFYLNYFFNINNINLYKKNIVWYRAELSKLYKHNITTENINRSISSEKKECIHTLEDYFNIHICFVSFKYRKQNKIWEDFWNNVDGEVTDLILEKWISIPEFQKIEENPDTLIKDFNELVEALELQEKHLFDPINLDKYHVKKFVSGEKARIRNSLISESILSYLERHGFKSLFIIDGLDNIDHYQYEDYYKSILSQVREFCLRDDKQNRFNAKVIVSLREETCNDLRSLHLNFFKNYKPPVYRIKPNDIEKIIRTKVSIALNPNCNLFKTKKISLSSKILDLISADNNKCNTDDDRCLPADSIIEKFDSSFNVFANNFLDQLLDAINAIIPDKYFTEKIDVKYLFEVIYNYNLRAFLNNFLNIYKYYRLFFEKKDHISEDHKYVLTEGQLLNGRLYLDTTSLPFDFGKCIPNIFWFDSDKLNGKWHGLCLVRLLQLLKHKKYSEHNLCKNLTSLFKYNENFVRQILCHSISHGLIACDFEEMQDMRFIKITKKGEFLLDYIFFDVNNFYMLVLDTPLTRSSVNNTKMVKFFVNDDSYWENYSESCVVTVITLLRHIMTMHKEEMECVRSKAQREQFKLPSFFPDLIINGLSMQIMQLKRFRNKSRYEGLINDLKGIVKY